MTTFCSAGAFGAPNEKKGFGGGAGFATGAGAWGMEEVRGGRPALRNGLSAGVGFGCLNLPKENKGFGAGVGV